SDLPCIVRRGGNNRPTVILQQKRLNAGVASIRKHIRAGIQLAAGAECRKNSISLPDDQPGLPSGEGRRAMGRLRMKWLRGDLQEQKGGERVVIPPLNVVVPAQPFGVKLSWVRPQAPVRLSHAQKEIHHPCLSLRNQSPVGGWDR